MSELAIKSVDSPTTNKPKPFQEAAVENPALLFAITGRLDALGKLVHQNNQENYLNFIRFAKTLNNERSIYLAYAALDGMNCANSMFKYAFDIVLADKKNPNKLSEFMRSPKGIILVLCETLLFAGVSFLAAYYDKQNTKASHGQDKNDKEKEENAKKNYQQYIMDLWPLMRDVSKGLKNTYKGWSSVVTLLNGFDGVNLKALILPVGMGLSLISGANRFYRRSIIEKRKQMLDFNKKLVRNGNGSPDLLKPHQYQQFARKILSQELDERIDMFMSEAINGLLDGLYLYMGAPTLGMLAGPALLAVTLICFAYVASCVLFRIYEEYTYQYQLIETQKRYKLNLLASCMNTLAKELGDPTKAAEREQHESDFCNLLKEYTQTRTELRKQVMNSYKQAMFLGMKHGLFTYGVLSSFLFMLTNLFTITLAPAFLITCISLGLAFMLVGAITMVVIHARQRGQIEKDEAGTFDDNPQLIMEKFNDIKRVPIAENNSRIPQRLRATPLLNPQVEKYCNELNLLLEQGKKIAGPNPILFQEFAEIFRSAFSGAAKGNNCPKFFANYFPKGKSNTVCIASILAFSAVFTGRAIARGWNKCDLPNKNRPFGSNIPSEYIFTPPASIISPSASLCYSSSSPLSARCGLFSPVARAGSVVVPPANHRVPDLN